MRYAVAVKKGSFRVGHVPEKLQLLFIVTTEWNYYSYYKGQSSLFQRHTSLHFSYMDVSLAEACAVINKFNFDTRKLLVYHFSLNTAATPFNFPIIM